MAFFKIGGPRSNLDLRSVTDPLTELLERHIDPREVVVAAAQALADALDDPEYFPAKQLRELQSALTDLDTFKRTWE